MGAGSQRQAKPAAVAPPAPTVAGGGPVPATASWADFEARWLAENKQTLSTSYLRAARQVVDGLAGFDASLRLAGLTKERLAQYVAWLYAQGKRDSTVQRHYKFLRECYRLAELPQPRWLGRFTARYGRSPTLRQAEVQALLLAELPADLAQERDAFLLQLCLLLRDVDLRALRPHHVGPHDLPGYGPTPCMELYQQKTSEPVRIPLPHWRPASGSATGASCPCPASRSATAG